VVTGGAGFIGSHTVEALLREGQSVLVVDNLYAGSQSNLPVGHNRLIMERIDISSQSSLWRGLRPLRECGDVRIIHLAAMVNVVEVRRRPDRAMRVNVLGTLNLLEAARRLDASRFVFSSSVAVYGEPQYLPIDENHPLNPKNLYGSSKLMGEMLVKQYYSDYSIPYAILRYFNVYGPRMRPGPYAGVVLRFIEALLGGSPPTIYGDGEQTRDFVYVGDVARANLLALRAGRVGSFNIGSGRSVSVNQLLETLCRLLNRGCPRPRRLPARPGDIRHSRASVEKARRELGWFPTTYLEKGLALTVDYYLRKAMH